MTAIRLNAAAAEELAAAVRFYEDQRAGLGSEFYDAVYRLLSHVQTHPAIGAAVGRDSRVRTLLVDRFPYRVV